MIDNIPTKADFMIKSYTEVADLDEAYIDQIISENTKDEKLMPV